MDLITATNITFSRKGHLLFQAADFRFSKAEFVAIIGPNGAGKSTLLQLLAGYRTPSTGKVAFHGKAMSQWSVTELATKRAYLQQQQSVFESFTVEDVLLMGRSVHFRGNPAVNDRNLVRESLTKLQLQQRAEQPFNSLSGGEQQRIQFARTLLQLKDSGSDSMEGKVLFLDEPLNNLDLYYQYHLLQMARVQITEKGGCVIAVLHDLNMVYRYADRVIMLSEGTTLMDAPVQEAMHPELLSAVYQLPIQKITPDRGLPYFSVATNQHELLAASHGEAVIHQFE